MSKYIEYICLNTFKHLQRKRGKLTFKIGENNAPDSTCQPTPIPQEFPCKGHDAQPRFPLCAGRHVNAIFTLHRKKIVAMRVTLLPSPPPQYQ